MKIEEPKLAKRWHTPCYDNLSGLVWNGCFTCRSYGARIGVRVDDPTLLDEVCRRLPAHVTWSQDYEVDCMFSIIRGGKIPGSRTRAYSLVYQNHTMIGRSFQLNDVLERFDSFFMLATAQLAPQHVFIHSGTVAIDGKVVLVPGKTLSGKSTIAYAFAKSGASYMSDEYAIINQEGMVEPYLKPIALRTDPHQPQTEIPLHDIGSDLVSEPLPAKLVLFTKYEPHGKWKPKYVAPGEGLIRLMGHCFGAQTDPDRVMRTLAKAFAETEFLRSNRGEAELVIRSVYERMRRKTAIPV